MTCIEDLTCGIFNSTGFKPMEIFKFYELQYGIPGPVILGMILGILIVAIYLWTRSINLLVILGIYAISVVLATWLSASVDVAFQSILWIIIIGIASAVVLIFLRLMRD